jgi:2-polyprenyl-3-methyl-5-hydroxy-6-metoxy-1,4-benzoquinol methylase
MQKEQIQTKTCPFCPVCGSDGGMLYSGLEDLVFYAPGVWSMKRCNNPGCCTLWLDPMPVEDDLPKLYRGYYTHQSASVPVPENSLVALSNRVQSAYLHAQYGYEPLSPSWLDKLLGLAVYFYPGWKDTVEASILHLQAKPGGRLLEIGCGTGAVLQRMQQKGWCVTGLDFDEGAVCNARSKGLDVHYGQLSAQGFADQTFDAVVMSHVIEHVPSPVELLIECHRVLKDDGVLVALTPNAVSSLHNKYGKYWRGLEIPRHLQIFTPEALASIADKAGYTVVEAFTAMNGFVYQDLSSRELAAGKKHVMGGSIPPVRRIISHMQAFCLGRWRVLFPGKSGGTEVVLVCRR